MASGNFCTWNPLVKGTENVSSGNCKLDMTTGNRGALGNFEIPLTGKWYFEGYIKMAANLEGVIGVSDAEVDLQSSRGGKNDGNTEALNFSQYSGSNYYAIKIDGGSEDAGGKIDLGTTDHAVIGVAVNRDDNELKLYANNTLRFTLTLSATTKYFPWCGVGGGTNSSVFVYLNAGQDSTFGGNKTAGGNADGNGFGDFFYSPPSNHIALCSANLPISDDIDPAQTDDDYPAKQFGVLTWTGTGSSNALTGLGFAPDLCWIKKRNSSQSHVLMDSTRGTSKALESNTNSQEDTSFTQGVTAFGTDGFTVGTHTQVNNSSDTYVGWCWRANGGTTASNSNGSITSTVQSNDKAGFSIITWTASGSNGSIGHGLSAAPDWHLIKKRNDSGSGWAVYHKSMGATKYLRLDTSGSASTFQYTYNNTEPDATKIYLGDNGLTNHPSGDTYICYAWREILGYSAFGKFEGNSDTDGPIIVTNFRPRLVFCKAIDASENWQVRDTARSTFNADSQVRIYWNSNAAEGSASTASPIEFLSNGFKVRGSNSEINSNTIIYGAWGDIPTRYGNTF